ncbi:MAG: pyridoxamine 5'-phosphate oxidase family protein [Nocardioides sp.]|nr:pyridoxamine 5'-phosphate oxidase family protein [Nocardioides sp.]
MTDPEIEHERLTSGDAAAITAVAEALHGALLDVDRAQEDLAGGVDDSGRIVIATYPQRAKTKNARQRSQVSVLVLSDEWDDAWVQVDGECEVVDAVDGPEALDGFVEYFRSIAGEHSDWDEYRAAMVEQGKSLLRITPTRWSTVSTGGFPPQDS